MKLINKLNNCKNYIISNNLLFIQTSIDFYCLNSSFEFIWKFQEPVSNFKIIDRTVVLQNVSENNLLVVKDNTGEKLIELKESKFYGLWRSLIKGSVLIISITNETEELDYYEISTSTFSKKKLAIKNSLSAVANETGFFYAQKSIFCVDIYSGDTYWRCSPSEKSVRGKMILTKDFLVVPIETSTLFGIDLCSGKVAWQLKNCLNFHAKRTTDNFLYGYGPSSFQVIDPIRGVKVLEKDFAAEHRRLRIAPAQNEHFIHKNKLYFISNFYGPKFGSINLDTYEIDFVQDLEVEKGVTAYTPTYHNGRLYILDTEETLHIFEEV